MKPSSDFVGRENHSRCVSALIRVRWACRSELKVNAVAHGTAAREQPVHLILFNC
jgi:hypothetical protein